MRVIIALWWRGRWKCRQEGWRQEAESVINKYASLCSVKCLSCHTFFSGTITDRGINKFIIRNYCLPSLSLKCEPITPTCCTTTTRSHKQQAKGFCCPRCTPLQSVCAALHLRLEWKSSDYHDAGFHGNPRELNSPICHGCQPGNGTVGVSMFRYASLSVHLYLSHL